MIIFPNPGATIGGNVLDFSSSCFATSELLFINFLDLYLFAFAFFGFWIFLLLLFFIIFIKGHTSFSHQDSAALLTFFLFNSIILLLFLNSKNVTHGLVHTELGDYITNDTGVLCSINHVCANSSLVQCILNSI